jgi:phage terminase small subunit
MPDRGGASVLPCVVSPIGSRVLPPGRTIFSSGTLPGTGLKRAETDLPAENPPVMAKTGPNYQATEVVPFGADRRLRPPDSLPDAARRAFADLVTSLPAGHFKQGDISLLCRYAEAVAAAEQAAFEMAQPGGMVTVDGRVSPWFHVHQQATKTLNALALRLRLGPQSRALKQSKKEAAPVSVYDRLRLNPNWDKPP